MSSIAGAAHSERECARKLFSGPCEFIAGAATLEELPETRLPEVAFVGRSNVGKSSMINALVGRSRLARVSKSPGRTRQINLFRIRERLMLADLPGYGFARVSKSESMAWNRLILGYLHGRKTLRQVCLLIDARRGVAESDEEVMQILDGAAVAYRMVLTKADVLATEECERARSAARKVAGTHAAALSDIAVTAAKSGAGIPELRAGLAQLAAP